ncbi:hypothetical protein Tco_0578675 [Tanacetum coccineum]
MGGALSSFLDLACRCHASRPAHSGKGRAKSRHVGCGVDETGGQSLLGWTTSVRLGSCVAVCLYRAAEDLVVWVADQRDSFREYPREVETSDNVDHTTPPVRSLVSTLE